MRPLTETAGNRLPAKPPVTGEGDNEMSDTKTCTPERLLEGFSRLSPEDQEKVRAELLKGAMSGQEGTCCDPTAMMQQMMARTKAEGCDPLAMCKEIMEKRPTGRDAAAKSSEKQAGCC